MVHKEIGVTKTMRVHRGRYQGNDSIDVAIDSGCAWEDSAYRGCGNLKKAFLPDNLYSIGNNAFQYCENLEHVQFGKSIERIGDYAFFGCHSLKVIVLPNSLYRLGDKAFAYSGLSEAIVPEGVVSIGRECFSHCTELRWALLPASLMTVGEGAFASCGDHLDLHVHSANQWFSAQGGNLLSKDGKTLVSCPTTKKTVSIPENITVLGDGAMSHCAVSQVHLPKELCRIGERAFCFCRNLHSITLPDGLQYIGVGAFRHSGLTGLTIPESVRYVGRDVLGKCKVQHLIILGDHTSMERICEPEDLQAGAMLTADVLEIKDYPEPFTVVHGLRSVISRFAAGRKVPDAALERFRKYLRKHFQKHWDDPDIFALIVLMRILPEKSMDEAIGRAAKMKDPLVLAMLLQYRQEMERWR